LTQTSLYFLNPGLHFPYFYRLNYQNKRICLSLDKRDKKLSILSHEESPIGYIHYDSSHNLLIFLLNIDNKISCELIFLNPDSDTFPEKILYRKQLFLEPFAEFIDFSPNPINFFVKFEKFFKIYDLNGNSICLHMNPLTFYQFKHSSQLLLMMEKPLCFKHHMLPFRVYDRKGQFLNTFELILKRNQGIEILDIFEFHLFFKQIHDELLIISLLNGEREETKGFVTPKCIAYHQNSRKKTLIFCFYAFGVQILSLNGQKLKEIFFSMQIEALFCTCIERRKNWLVMMKKSVVGIKSLLCIDLDDLDNKNTMTIIYYKKEEDCGFVFVSETKNIYVVSQDEILQISEL